MSSVFQGVRKAAGTSRLEQFGRHDDGQESYHDDASVTQSVTARQEIQSCRLPTSTAVRCCRVSVLKAIRDKLDRSSLDYFVDAMHIDVVPTATADEEDNEAFYTAPNSAVERQGMDIFAGICDDAAKCDGLSKSLKILQQARLRLYEEEVILGAMIPRMAVGRLSGPDNFGWRWFQCTDSLQVLLPPDAAICYDIFLRIERAFFLQDFLYHPSQYQKLLNARQDLIRSCIISKPDYPVRGITPSFGRYALRPGFRCEGIDDIVGQGDRSLDALGIDRRLVHRSDLGSLGASDERGRRWVRLTDELQILLPPDVAYQYQIFLNSIVTTETTLSGIVHDHELALANFVSECISSAKYLGRYYRDGLYVLERDSSSSALVTLDPIVKARDIRLAEEALAYSKDAPESPLVSDEDPPPTATRTRINLDAARLSVLTEKEEEEMNVDDSNLSDSPNRTSTDETQPTRKGLLRKKRKHSTTKRHSKPVKLPCIRILKYFLCCAG